MTETTHYHVEDVPPTDADTQVELYQQAREVVENGLQDGHRMFVQLEKTLSTLFTEAENVGDVHTMDLINNSWERVQRMAAIMGQQGAALTGANHAIDALTGQRDEIANELKELIKAIDNADVDHPQLEELHQTIQEWEMEYSETYAWDLVTEDITENVDSLLRDLMPEGGTYSATYMIADKIISALRGFGELTEDQKYFIVQLAQSFDVPRQGGAK